MTSKLTLKDPSLLRDTCFVGGEWIPADNGGTIKVDNPANGDLVGSVPNMGAGETKRAIEFANAARRNGNYFVARWHADLQRAIPN